jgi:hypothetical protein
MSCHALVDQELRAAEVAWKAGNQGRARVCARRAVAKAVESWLAPVATPPWRGDVMDHLRRIQQDEAFSLSVRQAAERLSTGVTKRQAAPFTVDPISDAKIVIAHLATRGPCRSLGD